jgi:glyoxylase-like metal-dependent hydrolase (beta-lactamase superfamily II)
MLDLNGTTDPLGDYAHALELFDELVSEVDIVIPGHGSVGDAAELRRRIDQDRAYIEALRDRREPDDPRIGSSAKTGWEWLSDVHERQVQSLK